MKVALREIAGNWDKGVALDKHSMGSVHIGYWPNGRDRFETNRTEVGEALYQLKYNHDWNKVQPLAQQIADSAVPLFPDFGLIIPMPPSKQRQRQPVGELAQALGKILGKPVFDGIIRKKPAPDGAPQLKDLASKQEKAAVLAGRFEINDQITNQGSWNALIVDDLFDSGASMEAVCATLRGYDKIHKIFVATLTWK